MGTARGRVSLPAWPLVLLNMRGVSTPTGMDLVNYWLKEISTKAVTTFLDSGLTVETEPFLGNLRCHNPN